MKNVHLILGLLFSAGIGVAIAPGLTSGQPQKLEAKTPHVIVESGMITVSNQPTFMSNNIQTWAYMTTKNLERANTLGRRGWELIGVSGDGYIWKKPTGQRVEEE